LETVLFITGEFYMSVHMKFYLTQNKANTTQQVDRVVTQIKAEVKG